MKSPKEYFLLISGLIFFLGIGSVIAGWEEKPQKTSSDKMMKMHDSTQKMPMHKMQTQEMRTFTKSTENIRKVQRALNIEGFSAGPVDGLYGARTAAAIRRFQRLNKLRITGTVNPETLDKLNIDYAQNKMMENSSDSYSE
ncbi:MAG: peptidoglycan-binding protein [Halobacteriovoraceae bacterium]|nr:peptidoglycan-binding protein [Halobacteriovoraceae bacterium]MCB9095185.1 peptidoglycan-binding protein [Halobacteriovoraceae bacterium]